MLRMTDNEDEGEEVQEGQASSHSQAMDDDDNAVDELAAAAASSSPQNRFARLRLVVICFHALNKPRMFRGH